MVFSGTTGGQGIHAGQSGAGLPAGGREECDSALPGLGEPSETSATLVGDGDLRQTLARAAAQFGPLGALQHAQFGVAAQVHADRVARV